MAKQDEARLILKLYDLRREQTMRAARDWYFREFNPESAADIQTALFSEHSGHFRMVTTYWDMAAALVNHGAIDRDLFNETNGEWFGVFNKIEPFMNELRGMFGPNYLMNLDKLADSTPNGRERLAEVRERFKSIRAQIAARQTQAAHSS